MKAIALQFGKAMSAALFVLLLVVAGVKNALAQTQVATLQHGDEISAFYGTNAFVDAYSAAHAGDIVTLSGGSFTTPNTIFKAITLRGAGVVTDTVAGTIPTIFNSIINIRVNNDTIPLIVEGILFNQDVHLQNLINPSFTRCNFKKIDNANSNSGVVSNAQFINCIINSFSNNININTTFINSVIWQATSIRDEHRVSLYNSILSNSEYYIIGLSAYNSIFISGGASPSSTCVFCNCIGINNTTNGNNPFGQGYTTSCINYTTYTDVFESFTGNFSLEESFLLKDEIATGFLGSDGTQVGIYGGYLPYSNRPSYMVMKRCNVANKSTIDGKLSVDIEVVTEEE